MSTTNDLLGFYFKPIEELTKKDGVTNININRYNQILYEQWGETIVWNKLFDSESMLENAIQTLANILDIQFGKDEPLLDARLPDGSRVNAGIPPVVQDSYVTIRVFPKKQISEEDLIKWGSMTRAMYEFIKLSILVKYNIINAGGTGSGKTTITQIMHNVIPKDRRLVIIEDNKELKARDYNCIAMEAPNRKNAKGQRIITFARLVENSLRLTPESIIVGELRGHEAAVAFRTLLNTGHSGMLTTLHADSSRDAMDRIRDMVQEGMPNTPSEVLTRGLYKSVNVVVYCENTENDGKRTVEIGENQNGQMELLFEWDFINKKHIIHTENLKKSKIWEKAKRFEVDISWIKELPTFM